MCEFLSGWINVETEQPEVADLQCHSTAQERFGWKGKEILKRREWEWTEDDDGKSLVVRTSPDDPAGMADNLRAALLVRWPTRQDAIRECILLVGKWLTTLYLNSLKSLPDGVVFPKSLTTLDLYSLESLLKGYKFPAYLRGRIYGMADPPFEQTGVS